MLFAFDAYVAAALFVNEGAAFALGDGTVRFESGETVAAHDGAVLCAAAHPSGSGLITGGDDGKARALHSNVRSSVCSSMVRRTCF